MCASEIFIFAKEVPSSAKSANSFGGVSGVGTEKANIAGAMAECSTFDPCQMATCRPWELGLNTTHVSLL